MPQRQYYQNVLQHLASTQEQEVFPTNHHTHTRISTAMATVGLACLGKKQNEKELKLTLLIMEKKVPMTTTILISTNIIAPLKLERHINSMTEGHESTRFANAVLSVSMNKDRWNSLPPEIQSAFRKASDESFLRRIGQVWSDYEKPGIDRLIQYKKKHIVLTEAETKAFEDKLKPVTERWIKEVEKEGIDGRKLVNKARKLIKKYEE